MWGADVNRDLLLADLETCEGFRPYLYDDANGKPLVKGSTIIGNPTVGIGWCPSTLPIPHDKAQVILGWQADDVWGTLIHAASWIGGLSEPRQRALANMAFQLGVTGLLKFNVFIGLMQQGRYAEAADDLATTLWFKQSGNRGPRIQQLIKGE